MKKVFKALLYLCVLFILIIVGFVGFLEVRGIPKYDAPKEPDIKVEVTPERVVTGAKIASVQCIFCHKSPDGKVSGKQVTDMPPEFGVCQYHSEQRAWDRQLDRWRDHLLPTDRCEKERTICADIYAEIPAPKR